LSADPAYTTADTSRLDAAYSIDGGPTQTSSSNVLENAVPGLRITLKGVTAAAATVSVGAPEIDRDAIKGKVKAFVDAYNAVVDTTRAKLTEKPLSSPTSSFQAGLGQLYGDTGLTSMLSNLRAQMTEIVSGAGINDLADLGIGVPKATGGAVSEDGKAGRLVLDEAKLTETLEGDWTGVKSFFSGFADEVETFVKGQTGGSGVIDSRLQSSDRNIDRIQDQVDRTNERLDVKEKRMRAQFAAMEVALQNAQSQQAWLTGQIAALERNTGS
jgi:flagellar hook-associated protein 2